MENELFVELLKDINDMKVIDTHEHTIGESERIAMGMDVFNLFEHYASADCVSAGLHPDIMDKCVNDKMTPLEARWNEFREYWNMARNTTYSEAVLIAINDLLGYDDLNDHNFMDVSKKLRESYVQGWYKKVLLNKCNIEKCIINLDKPSISDQMNVDRELFSPVMRFDYYLNFTKKSTIELLEIDSGVSIHNLQHLLKAFDSLFEKTLQARVSAIKFALAYQRSIDFERQTKAEAENELNNLLKETRDRVHWLDEKAVSQKDIMLLQNYLVRYIIEFAEENNIPIQMHTGLQEGYGNYVTNSNPLLIVKLLMEYKKARFALLHGGYPFNHEIISIAKNFHNAYLDMCWLHIISRKVAVDFLDEAIEMIPVNKIFGFGGDFRNVEGTYGHLKIARQNIARTLTGKVIDKQITQKQALEIAKRILYDNPYAFYNI